jgi:Arc/MetJ-type ribon-helix-helix transcriptional regulator
MVNVILGAPYEAAIKRIIASGYAGSQTEVIRQSILAYEKVLKAEEMRLVGKGVEADMADIKSGKVGVITLEELEKKYGLTRT